MLRLALLAALAATGMGNAYAGYTNDDVNPWADDAKEWECAMPVERPASNDKTPFTKRKSTLPVATTSAPTSHGWQRSTCDTRCEMATATIVPTSTAALA